MIYPLESKRQNSSQRCLTHARHCVSSAHLDNEKTWQEIVDNICFMRSRCHIQLTLRSNVNICKVATGQKGRDYKIDEQAAKLPTVYTKVNRIVTRWVLMKCN